MHDFFLRILKRTLRTPKDDILYTIPASAIHDTERILKEYGRIIPPNEGLVYWGGHRNGNLVTITIVIAPFADSDIGRVSVSNRSNFDFVRALNRHNLIHIAQVHSHPGRWVDHSPGDDYWAAFKREGLLSIVIPEYCRNGMLSLDRCGVHRYTNDSFVRLSTKYIKTHFQVSEEMISFLQDFRK